MIVVRRPGLLTTVQDEGRHGWAWAGVPRAGAVDAAALAAGNLLVGNPRGAAGLEATLRGPELELPDGGVVALTGAMAALTVNGHESAYGVAVEVPPGGVVRVGTARVGLRPYLAVRGGIDVVPVLGSRSTDTLTGLGPAPLRKGDVLAVGPAPAGPLPDAAGPLPDPAERVAPPPDIGQVLPVLPGPRGDLLPPGAFDRLLATAWTVSRDSDRTAVRLAGPSLVPAGGGGTLPSEGLVPGAVQVPPDGQPVLFLAPPTTGGYPVLAVVTTDGLSGAAQLRPGNTVHFAAGGRGIAATGGKGGRRGRRTSAQ